MGEWRIVCFKAGKINRERFAVTEVGPAQITLCAECRVQNEVAQDLSPSSLRMAGRGGGGTTSDNSFYTDRLTTATAAKVLTQVVYYCCHYLLKGTAVSWTFAYRDVVSSFGVNKENWG